MLKCSVPPTPIIMNLPNPKSLLRSIESARQMSTNINMEIENGGQLSQEFLKKTCRLSLGGWYHYACSGNEKAYRQSAHLSFEE